jgi:glycosyltransferase involved in cell wall biosynthesis
MGELLILRMLRARKVPFLVYSAQNIEKRYPPPFRWFERWCLREAAGAYPCNEAAGEILRKKGLRGFLVNLPLGFDPADFVPAQRDAPIPGRLHIGYVGRLAAHKGVDILLRAVALTENVTAEIVGDGPAARQLEQLAHSIGLDDRVAFIGHLPPSDLPEFYRRFDAVVVPSIPMPGWDEQFCRVAVEAMASGVPVIASSTGALPEVIGSGGLFVPPGDPQALAQALQTLSSQSELWASLRSAGLLSVDRFFWSTVAKRQEVLYQRSVSSRNANATV